MKKIANDLIHTNSEFEKLKAGKMDDSTPRETPSGQGPGRSGYDKQMFDEWTTEELRDYAIKLGVQSSESLDRESLQKAIEARDATQHRIESSAE